MRYLIFFLALIPLLAMGVVYAHTLGFEWFDAAVVWCENAFGIHVFHPRHLFYYLSFMAGKSALWILIFAFWISPLYTFVRFDLREFKKTLGGFSIGYAFLHLLFFALAYGFSVNALSKAMMNHPFLSFGVGALLILALAPLSKAGYKFLYLGVVAVIIHLLLGDKILSLEHIVAVSLLATAMALRLIKR
ncbi:MAG TPA: hypothetical protein VFX68_06795 [Sulfuricurvum sp.]|nr:hypothetical protein [Sulfuricurvum sp.]